MSDIINEKLPFVWYGGDYNPDQWDDATLDRDMELFKKAHINFVTLPVFSWAKLEPEEGRYEFAWLDRILDRLWQNRIYVCLATPTTAQPAWLSLKYPEVLPMDIQGRKRNHGMRVFFCVNSEKYRERAAALAEQMALRYKNYPGLAVWHVANEYGTYCFCENCQRKFRLWLKAQYGSVEGLNEAWNLSFWGRTLTGFDELFVPSELNDDYRFYPQIMHDYIRFTTASTIDCYENEKRILKKYTPDIPVTTNISGHIEKLNQFEFAKHVDVVGWDNYPSPNDPPGLIALRHDLMRGLKGGKPFMITEQSPNQQNWQPYNRLKRPGEVRLLAWQAMAHGADTCLFFQMRQSVSGQEKLHGAVIAHSGREDTRVFREITELGAELEKLGGAFLGTRIKAEVGVLFDWENWWAVALSSGPNRDIRYLEQVRKYYEAFWSKNIPVDILSVDADLSPYKVVVTPMLYQVKQGLNRRLEAFASNGGVVVSSVFSGIVAENDKVALGGYPGRLRELLGLWVEETDALNPAEKNSMQITAALGGLKGAYSCGSLCDVIHTEAAEAMAVYGGDYYKGTPCFTRNAFGKGCAWYVGTDPEQAFLDDFAALLCRELGLSAPLEVPIGVEITMRGEGEKACLFVINHRDGDTELALPGSYENLLTGETVSGTLRLGQKAVAVLRAL